MTSEVASQEVILDRPGLEEVSVHDVLNYMRSKDKSFDSEKFANEELTIRLAEAQDQYDDPVPCVIVNGSLMPFPRGQAIKAKRKYVEVLARAREIRYEQKAVNPMQPDQIELRGRVVQKYPFEVLKDPNPAGRRWLDAIRNEPV